ncbi:hypothetical protein ACGF12_29595 [Kitasatospora sp. NPDC048296]|uniref:hypothetical protein n=1 Tax=Kitasatospora sp. NPDC048296 TaxID=3364048 RepID=UPI00371B98BE
MNARRAASRPARGPARMTAFAVALAALGAGGTVDAPAAPATPPATPPATTPSTPSTASARPGPVPVQEARTAAGVLTVYRSAARPQTVSPAPAPGDGDATPPTWATTCNGVNPKVCFTVDGSGYYVRTMENSTYYGASTWADIQIKSPSGAVVTGTSFHVTGGTWYTTTYTPNGYVTAGWWCGFSDANGGVYTGSCINVSN